MKPNPRITLPAPPGKSYLPYQEAGIRYALGARGTLIADEMGLGKTVQAIGIINASPAGAVVIVCPAGLKTNWRYELDNWLVDSKRDIIILSYYEAGKFVKLVDVNITILIVDEAHYIKNPDSRRSQVITELAKKANRVLLLTGTPMENRPVELWPLLKIVCPEKWDPAITRIGTITQDQRQSHPGEGPNFWTFAKRYCDLKKTSFRFGTRFRKVWDFSGASNLTELRKRLRETCMVRRLKQDVLPELPEKCRQVFVLPSNQPDDGYLASLTFENYERAIAELTSSKVKFEEFSRRRHEEGMDIVDDALVFLRDALDETQKIIVFAHHIDVIERLASGLTAEFDKADYAVKVTGGTHVADRGAAVKAFQEDPLCRVFIGSIGAAGVGITLTAATLVVFVELTPVPGQMTQAEDRAHRIGQKNFLLVKILVKNHSLGARLAKIIVRKQAVLKEGLDG